MDIPWVIAHDATEGELAYSLECKRCKTIQYVALPISVDCWCAIGDAFLKFHRRCPDRSKKRDET